MAAVTFGVGTADSNISPVDSDSFTPASGDLLIAMMQSSATNEASPTCTSSISGFTFSFIGAQIYSTTQSAFVFVSDALVSDTSPQTVTFDCPNDPTNGQTIFVHRVSGMSKSGLDAIRQWKGNTALAAVQPSVTLDASPLTENPLLAVLGNITNPAGITPPPSWTEPVGGDLGYSSPTSGASTCFRDSGETNALITWDANSPSVWGAIVVELDTSSPAAGEAKSTKNRLMMGVG